MQHSAASCKTWSVSSWPQHRSCKFNHRATMTVSFPAMMSAPKPSLYPDLVLYSRGELSESRGQQDNIWYKISSYAVLGRCVKQFQVASAWFCKAQPTLVFICLGVDKERQFCQAITNFLLISKEKRNLYDLFRLRQQVDFYCT